MKQFLFMLAGALMMFLAGCSSGPKAVTTEISGPLGKAFVLAGKSAKVVQLAEEEGEKPDWYLEVEIKLKDASQLPEGYSKGTVGCVDDLGEDGIESIAGFGVNYTLSDGEMCSTAAHDDTAYFSPKELRQVLRLDEGKSAVLHLWLDDVESDKDIVETFCVTSFYADPSSTAKEVRKLFEDLFD